MNGKGKPAVTNLCWVVLVSRWEPSLRMTPDQALKHAWIHEPRKFKPWPRPQIQRKPGVSSSSETSKDKTEEHQASKGTKGTACGAGVDDGAPTCVQARGDATLTTRSWAHYCLFLSFRWIPPFGLLPLGFPTFWIQFPFSFLFCIMLTPCTFCVL